MELKDRIRDLLDILGGAIHKECHEYAIRQMADKDFILLSDANGVATEDIIVKRVKDEQEYTIKNSSREKYNDFYGKMLEDVTCKFLGKKTRYVD